MVWLAALLALPSGCQRAEPETGATSQAADVGADGTASELPSVDAATVCQFGSTDAGACAPAPVCAPCVANGDCGSGVCKPDALGHGYCTRPCTYFGAASCPTGTFCRQLGAEAEAFFCFPDDGICTADGSDCSPCATSPDCAQGLECVEPFPGVRTCARNCTESAACAAVGPALACAQLAPLTQSYCHPKVDGRPTARCGQRPLGFCEPCKSSQDCTTGQCVDDPNIGRVCTKPCTSKTDCPAGTSCRQSVCLPALLHGCQGWLGCQGVECPTGQVCHRGFCIPPP